jgi:outer membrane receptor protein involved in Fe transport
MIDQSRIARAVKRALLLSLASAAGATAPQAFAADAAPDDSSQTIVVTGSRIATPELESPVPVTIVSDQAIQSSGQVNISDVLRELPSVGTSALSTTNSNFLTGDSGINTINLRNLGDQRTLVLVNGRRFTPGVPTTSEVDFNMIPTDLIDHIEILTGGASAVYGSDAVAGVVNVIYKTKLDGIETHFQGGLTDVGDAGRYSASVNFGQPFADGRGHALVNVTWNKEAGLLSSQRAMSSIDDLITSAPGAVLSRPAYSSYAPQGRFEYTDANGNLDKVFTFLPGNTLKNGFSTAKDGFNRDPFRRISVPLDRTLATSLFDYDLTDKHHAYAEISYGVTRTQSQIEPFALASSGTSGSVYGGANATTLDPVTGVPIGVPITNAFIPASVTSSINAWNAANPTDQIQYIQFRKRLIDIADRGNSEKRQTWRSVVGVRGDLPFDDWTYDASYVFGRTTGAQVSSGQVNLNNVRMALDSVNVNGQIVCRDPVAQSLGCVPLNLFGFNSITPAMAAWVNAPVTRNSTIQEQVFSGNIEGPLVHLPAGAMTLVLGAEQRKDSDEVLWDALTNLGLNGGNQLPNVKGSFTVKEGFAEVKAPILKDLPFAKSLDINGAYRQSDYSTVGSVHSWKGGLEWAPISPVRFRGEYAEAIRAPSVGELYGGVSQTFPSVSDPCDGVTATSTGKFDAACRAIPGIAKAIASNGVFQYQQVDLQTITGFDGSNANLKAETAKTATLGVVFQPDFVPGFTATVDYYHIQVDGAVSTITRGDSINQCLATGSPTFCGNVIRSATTGKILAVNAQNTNVGGIKTAGFETSIRYQLDLRDTFVGGKLNLMLAENHLLQLEQINFPGAGPTDNRGELNDGSSQTRLGAGFEDRATLTADYTHGPLEFVWTARYMSSIQDTLAQNGIVSPLYNSVPAYVYHDMQIRFKFGKNSAFETYVGMTNVFDKQPPFLPQGMASEITGTETAADTYDVFGRFIYGGISAKF